METPKVQGLRPLVRSRSFVGTEVLLWRIVRTETRGDSVPTRVVDPRLRRQPRTCARHVETRDPSPTRAEGDGDEGVRSPYPSIIPIKLLSLSYVHLTDRVPVGNLGCIKSLIIRSTVESKENTGDEMSICLTQKDSNLYYLYYLLSRSII